VGDGGGREEERGRGGGGRGGGVDKSNGTIGRGDSYTLPIWGEG